MWLAYGLFHEALHAGNSGGGGHKFRGGAAV